MVIMSILDKQSRFAVDEYHAMADTGILAPDERVELLQGVIVPMSPIGERHAACTSRRPLWPIVAALDDPDAEIRRAAVSAAGNWEVDAAWPHVSALLAAQDTDKALLLVAIEAGAYIRPQEAESLLPELSDSGDAEIAAAAGEAMMMAAVEDELDADAEW